MNHIDWMTNPDPYQELYHLTGGVHDRQLRLAGIAAARQSKAVLENELSVRALDLSERFADGLVERGELDAAYFACLEARAELGDRVERVICGVGSSYQVSDGLVNSLEALRELDRARRRPNGTIPASREHRAILHDIFGRIFRPFLFDPRWRTTTVEKLARTIYDERTFDELPVLADALEDAGCTWTELLQHLREPGFHTRGCWALDQCLGIGEVTQADWLTTNDSLRMYLYAHPLLSARKLRLMACAFARRLWDLAGDFFQELLVPVENHAEGIPPREEELVYLKNDRIFGGDGPITYAFGNLSQISAPSGHTTGEVLRNTASARAEEAFLRVIDETGDPGSEEADRANREGLANEQTGQAHLIRCIVGNPFDKAICEASWRTPDIVAMARSIYDTREFDRLPELADALSDAGCSNEPVLSHCRADTPHARGCWVLDAILDRG